MSQDIFSTTTLRLHKLFKARRRSFLSRTIPRPRPDLTFQDQNQDLTLHDQDEDLTFQYFKLSQYKCVELSHNTNYLTFLIHTWIGLLKCYHSIENKRAIRRRAPRESTQICWGLPRQWCKATANALYISLFYCKY